MHKKKISIMLLSFIAIISLIYPTCLSATYEYAKKTGKGCSFCHYDSNGGPLKDTGYAFIKNSYNYPIPKEILEQQTKERTIPKKIIDLLIGYLHLIASIILIGAIFYIHVFIKPINLTGGLPKPERILGVICLAVISFTGIYLTINRINSLKQFFESSFGIILFIKILLFILMLLNAIIVVSLLHKKMKEKSMSGPEDASEINISNINQFNGQSGKPAYIAYENRIYDVSKSKHWKDGRHYAKHSAGSILTKAMKGAPHGPELLERVKLVREVDTPVSHSPLSAHQKIFMFMAYMNLIILFLILLCVGLWRWGFPLVLSDLNRMSKISGTSCIECHQQLTAGIYSDWRKSVHSKVGVDCYKCHKAGKQNKNLINRDHLDNTKIPTAIVVSPRICAGCHPKEYNEYAKSKHANTHEIIWKVDKWFQHGMNNAIERTTGCYTCHGTVVELKEGKPVSGTWPNVGVGRKNPDGSLGSCSSCHTRHKFSVIEARKPEACDQCHLGPDHPQIEIYNESKHGTIYHAEGDTWNWSPKDNQWRAGRDFRAPTCSACHMSAADGVNKTHDVTERLSWEMQAPLTVRPGEFKPFPAKTEWEKERSKMKMVCHQCHSENWTSKHFVNLDRVIQNYNDNYYKPVAKEMKGLYSLGHLSEKEYFDEELEWEFYELWHHEGRRARMGAAMMAPDYAWWHGFYELKHRYVNFMEKSKTLKETGNRYRYYDFPGKLKK